MINNSINSDLIKTKYSLSVKEDIIYIKETCYNCNSNVNIINKVVKATKDKEYLYLDLKLTWQKKIKENKFEYYSDSSLKTIKESIENENINWDKYDTYTYVFKLNNNDYYLEKINKINEEGENDNES